MPDDNKADLRNLLHESYIATSTHAVGTGRMTDMLSSDCKTESQEPCIEQMMNVCVKLVDLFPDHVRKLGKAHTNSRRCACVYCKRETKNLLPPGDRLELPERSERGSTDEQALKSERDPLSDWDTKDCVDQSKRSRDFEPDLMPLSIDSDEKKLTLPTGIAKAATSKKNAGISSKQCLPSSNRKGNSRRHRNMNIVEKPFICDYCSASFTCKNKLILHTRVHTGEKPFRCDLCAALFASRGGLKVHTRVHTGEKPFHCDLCDGSFCSRAYMSEHMRIHTGEKPFSCDLCASSFNSKSQLRLHMRVHTGEKPFFCDRCAASFTTRFYLKVHMRLHTGEKPFSCNECAATFRQKGHLAKHMKVHTGEKPYGCKQCPAAFNSCKGLKRHLRIHTGEIHLQ